MILQRNKIVTVFAVIFLVILIILGLFYYLLNFAINIATGIKSVEEKLVEITAEIEEFEGFQIFYEEMELGKIDNLLADLSAPINLIEFLEETASEENVDIVISLSTGRQLETDLWGSVFFQINAVGNFNDSLRFFEKVERAPFLIKVQRFNIRKLENLDPFERDTALSFLIKVYAR